MQVKCWPPHMRIVPCILAVDYGPEIRCRLDRRQSLFAILCLLAPTLIADEPNVRLLASAKIAAVSANSDRRRCEVTDLARNLLREDAPEADDLIVPRIGCFALQLKRNALMDYRNPGEPRGVSGKHHVRRPPQAHPDR